MGIRVENITRSYGPNKVLDQLSLDVPEGSFTSVVAPTGAGKTTLLRIMAGVETPNQGTVYYNGNEVTRKPVQERSVGMVYQEFINFPSLTVYENIASPLRVSTSMTEDEIDREVRETADLLRIDHILDHLPEEVSGGEAQRTAIARAMIKKPRFLFMDEPLANLDYKLREQLRSDFKRLFAEGETTVIYATPDSGDALAMSTHIGFLHEGRILQFNRMKEIYYHPERTEVASYLGEPPMNLLPVTWSEEDGEGSFTLPDGNPIRAPYFESLEPGQQYIIGFRPQDTALDPKEEFSPLSVEVAFSETVGEDTTLHLQYNERELYLLTPQPITKDRGEQIQIYIDPEKIYVFDRDTRELVDQGPRTRPQ